MREVGLCARIIVLEAQLRRRGNTRFAVKCLTAATKAVNITTTATHEKLPETLIKATKQRDQLRRRDRQLARHSEVVRHRIMCLQTHDHAHDHEHAPATTKAREDERPEAEDTWQVMLRTRPFAAKFA